MAVQFRRAAKSCRMKTKLLFAVFVALCLAFGAGCEKPAQKQQVVAAQPEKVRIASGGHIVHFLPLDLAAAKGFFKDEGLEPEITQLKSGPAPAQALIAGQVDFSMNSIDHAFKAAVQGKDDLRMVVLLNQLPGMVLVADGRLKDEIKTIADLKGRALGVTSKGSATHMVLAALLARSGVSPQDVTIVDAGSSTFPPALENRQIVGGIALEPFASVLVEQGKAFVLADLNTLKDTKKFFGGPYNQAGVLTRQELINKRPDLVQKVVNVHVRALKWIQTHSAQEIADALPAEVVGSDKARYVKTLEKLREFYSPDGAISLEGARNVLESMKHAGALAEDTKIQADTFIVDSSKLPKPPANAAQDSPKSHWWMLGVGLLVLLVLALILKKK